VRIHYATLGTPPHRNAQGDVENAVLVLHWTGADGRVDQDKGVALNFSDDEFNPAQLHVLDRLMPKVPHGRFIVQEGSESSLGHLTMAHPDLWFQHVGEFMHELGDASPYSNGP
jgi:hypothetical protein